MENEVRDLIDLSATIIAKLKAPEESTEDESAKYAETLVEQATQYMDRFEAWLSGMEGKNPLQQDASISEGERLRALLEHLQRNHLEVEGLIADARGQVAHDLSQLHHRGKALKTYIDRFPSRISITGKRKG